MPLIDETNHPMGGEFTREGAVWQAFVPDDTMAPPPREIAPGQFELPEPPPPPYDASKPCDVRLKDGREYGPCWANSGQFEIVPSDPDNPDFPVDCDHGFIYEEKVADMRSWEEKPEEVKPPKPLVTLT